MWIVSSAQTTTKIVWFLPFVFLDRKRHLQPENMFSMCSKAPPQTPCSVNGCGELLCFLGCFIFFIFRGVYYRLLLVICCNAQVLNGWTHNWIILCVRVFWLGGCRKMQMSCNECEEGVWISGNLNLFVLVALHSNTIQFFVVVPF